MRQLLIGAMVLAGATAAQATVTVAMDFRQIVGDANVIVRGHITDLRVVELPTREIESIATVAVDNALKGTTDAFVYVRVPGGTLGRERVVVVDAPQLVVGEQAEFFLHRGSDNALRPVALSLGVFRIGALAATGQLVVNPPLLSGYTAAPGPVVHGDPSRKLMSVPDFESLVKLVVAAPGGQPAGSRR